MYHSSISRDLFCQTLLRWAILVAVNQLLIYNPESREHQQLTWTLPGLLKLAVDELHLVKACLHLLDAEEPGCEANCETVRNEIISKNISKARDRTHRKLELSVKSKAGNPAEEQAGDKTGPKANIIN